MMDPSKARPLEALDFRFRPLAPLALAWSCDAELAVALDDAIHVLIPEYPKEKSGGGDNDAGFDEALLQPQFSLSLQVSGIFRPEPSINAKLCAAAGVVLPARGAGDEFRFRGVGHGLLSRSGAALGQTVRVEWSPSGLGQNLRPVLAALTTNGGVVTLGEHIDPASTVASGATARSFKNWRVLWGLGALLPVPDGTRKEGFREMEDKIVAFSWAREVLPGRALLAYANDAGRIAIMGVQHFPGRREEEASQGHESVWQLRELARFDGRGPHKVLDPHDPDFVPFGSAFSLKWSPWHVSPDSRTATLAYIAHNYVGFRRITITGAWERARNPALRVEQTDTTAFCMNLGPDAFVEWEDAVWPDGSHGQTARGIIATPFVPKPFQVDLCAGPSKPMAPHATSQCATVYPADEDASTNPITGLVVHRPDPHDKPAAPRYTMVRLSATAATRDWYRTNVPEDAAAAGSPRLPQWAEYVRAQTARVVPRLAAMQGVDSDSESEDMEDEYLLGDGRRPMSRVHPHRFRLWGLAASPGDACSAVLVTKHSTHHPHRRALSKLLFAWPERGDPPPPPPPTAAASRPRLTTEGRLWEAVYGCQGSVADIVPTAGAAAAPALPSPLRDLFRDVVSLQRCVFCVAPLRISFDESACENGHLFATCAASGLAIMAPGVSRLCAVCGLRCLKVGELAALARRLVGPDAVVDSTGDVCGGCGGKFVA
ncbi:transcription factor IIIC subunit delta N-term domain-containing protein [Hirsutella rhossiliensis]|uniref:Transcription factor IIIC subunit delta n-term domain-containing protein n=1 Tax=Hirsutella rhossiliensis TaxID=111463 RepID=A0A9P8SK49_9HYPO|nr:transcription factor IIIC subunit delta n-term domain-containing protein [Hirsutella rhossiliensis]KAH0965566.1 transcription factor IIIC subunit delta n-term domain-containing protein [Hirsutella rhossiliensis]